METAIDVRVADMLCSRLCHDLISPVGAIKSGFELITEFGGDPDEEAMSLIGGSAEQAAAKLQFFRVAYGLAGSGASAMTLAAAAAAARVLIGGGRTTLDWQTGGEPEAIGSEALKLLLNMILLGAEALPKGGTLRVSLIAEDAAVSAEVVADGEAAGLKPELIAAFEGSSAVDALTPRTVQGFYTSLLGRRMGTQVILKAGPVPHLTCRLPPVA